LILRFFGPTVFGLPVLGKGTGFTAENAGTAEFRGEGSDALQGLCVLRVSAVNFLAVGRELAERNERRRKKGKLNRCGCKRWDDAVALVPFF